MSRAVSRQGPRRLGLAALSCVALALAAGPVQGDAVVADLSGHRIAINSGFTGTSVVLFGATEGAGEVIAVVRGPEREMTVWHKGKVAGVWVNSESMTFINVPSGDYRVEIFLAKDREVVSGQTTPLRVEEVGIDAQVSDFARREAAVYGAIAVLTAAVAGWLASLPFRGV